MRFFWLLQLLVLVLGPSLIYAWLHRGAPSRALSGGGLILVATYTLLFGMFAAGSALMDPGGWAGFAYTGGWLGPLIVLSLLARRRPEWGVAALLVLTAGFAGACIWFAISPQWWITFQDNNGPILGLIALTLIAPLGVLGTNRPRIAGVALLALPVLSVLAMAAGAAQGFGTQAWPVAIGAAPAAIAGVAFLASTLVRNERAAPPARSAIRPRRKVA